MNVVDIEQAGALTRVTLNRPTKANALDDELVEALIAVVDHAATDGTRLMTFQANGKNFSAGFDFTDFETQTRADLLWRFVRIEQLLQAVYYAPFATATFAHGRNFGAGADLFVACSTRIIAPDTSFRMPGLLFGIQLGTRRLAACIGADGARDLLGAARTVAGTDCVDIGFANRLAPRDEWPEAEQQLLEDACALAESPAARLRRATRADTRAEDLADLVISATEGDLKERIRAYRSLRG